MKTQLTAALDLAQFTGHTPGPHCALGNISRANGYFSQEIISVPDTICVARVYGKTREELNANGLLFCAAPQLLAQLRESQAREVELVNALAAIVAADKAGELHRDPLDTDILFNHARVLLAKYSNT